MTEIHISEEEIVATARPEHFVRAVDREAAKNLFKHSVDFVELEVFSFCNRKCWFCPNSTIDRHTSNNYMDFNLYRRILNELREIDFSGTVSYSRYNEPLADRVILERIREARAALPNVHLLTYTNGDYLDRPYLDQLREAGLNSLNIMTYLGNNTRFTDEKVLTRMINRLVKLGLTCEFTEVINGVSYSADVRYKGMSIKLLARNFEKTGVDRGGQVEIGTYRRTSWCPIVFKHVYVDWNGAVVPCCNIRSDVPEHKSCIVDELSTGRSIFEAYATSPLVDWRRSLFNYGDKQKPCDTCAHAVPQDTPELRAVVEDIRTKYIR